MENQNVDIKDIRVARMMKELMPLSNPLNKERAQLDRVEFSKITTFITPRPISRELAFYYLIHNHIIDFVKLFTAEEIKDIYLNLHPDYGGLNDVSSPIIVVLLGKELYNKQMITMLNILVDNFSRWPIGKALIFVYEGTTQDFKFKYKNAQERGVLNSGKTISLTQTTKSASTNFEY